jgi:hypothetical protein
VLGIIAFVGEGGIAMQEGNKKKKWFKPKLIILTRGKPEEAVLGNCKATAVASGSGNKFRNCLKWYSQPTQCDFCSATNTT